MKIFKSLAILIFSSLSLLLAQQPTTVRLAIGDWAPYTSPTDPKGKLAEEIVTQAFAEVGITTNYSYYPWKRSLEMAKGGAETDGTFPWNSVKERNVDFILNKEPIMKDDAVYFHLKTTKFDWKTLVEKIK